MYQTWRKVGNILSDVRNIHIQKVHSSPPLHIPNYTQKHAHISQFEKVQKSTKKKMKTTQTPISENNHCYHFDIFPSNLLLSMYTF